MTKKSLSEAFDISPIKNQTKVLSDYDVFPNKVLLDNLRNQIIQNILDNKIPDDKRLYK